MPARKRARRADPASEEPDTGQPGADESGAEDERLPQYPLPIVITAFAAGVFIGTRAGRHLACGVVRAGLLAVKPALVVGGLLKLREFSASHPPSPTDTPP